MSVTLLTLTVAPFITKVFPEKLTSLAGIIISFFALAVIDPERPLEAILLFSQDTTSRR